jgi:UDP-N-acetylmuramate dehydrogenase
MKVPGHWIARWPLTRHCTLGVHSEAEFGLIAHTETQLIEALRQARALGVQSTVLGGGSNVIPAREVSGLVIKAAHRGLRQSSVPSGVQLEVAGGERWHDLVRASLGYGLQGLECLALIPGSVGAAPIQNIGAYGQELADRCVAVRVYSAQTDRVQTLPAAQCAFSYRSSRFKTADLAGSETVLSVTLQLPTAGSAPLVATYPDIARELLRLGIAAPGPIQVAEAVCRVRRRKLPDWRRLGNVGSVFKNPVVSQTQLQRLRQEEPALRAFPDGGGMKLAAGQLIELCGWKGQWQGTAGVWKRQALVLVQDFAGSARQGRETPDGTDFLALLAAVRESVQARFQIELEVEPRQLR